MHQHYSLESKAIFKLYIEIVQICTFPETVCYDKNLITVFSFFFKLAHYDVIKLIVLIAKVNNDVIKTMNYNNSSTAETGIIGKQKVKFVVIGDGGCGKTSLLVVYVDGEFPEV